MFGYNFGKLPFVLKNKEYKKNIVNTSEQINNRAWILTCFQKTF